MNIHSLSSKLFCNTIACSNSVIKLYQDWSVDSSSCVKFIQNKVIMIYISAAAEESTGGSQVSQCSYPERL